MDVDVRSSIWHYFLRTGKIPVPQRINFLLVVRQEQARCLFHKESIFCLWSGHLARQEQVGSIAISYI
jgi:hypothetical protein